MDYNFQRYVEYMINNRIDAVIASNYKVTARMLGRFNKDCMWMSVGAREFTPLVGCDSRGEMIHAEGWHFDQGIDELCRVLKERGIDHGTIGLEMLDFPARGLRMIEERLPQATFVDASWLVHQDIAKKTKREVELIRQSVKASEAGFRETVNHMRECLGKPVSELMWRYYAPEVNRYGAELLGSNLSAQAGEWQDDQEEPTVCEGGEPINFDLVCGYQGLMSDIAFRGVVGEPNPEFSKRFEKSVLVVEALVKSIQPGITAAEAEAVCLENMIKAVGSWDGYWAVHNAGFHLHEFPQIGSAYLGRFGDYVFEAGQVLSVEAIAEQAFVLTEHGMHRLGDMPMKIYCA